MADAVRMPGMDVVERLASLAVEFGANVQPGQVLEVKAEIGHENVVRAVADAAYRAGASYVDMRVIDPYVDRSRVRHGSEDALDHVPSWEVERIRTMGREGHASIKVTGPSAPGLFDDLDPSRVARASLSSLSPEWRKVELLVNWTVVPSPTVGWAQALQPELPAARAVAELWNDITIACRLDTPDPVQAWRQRLKELQNRARALTALKLTSVHFEGPGTDLSIGLLPGARWEHPVMLSGRGIEHVPNLPTEEVFTVPDPTRVDGHVRLTRPALVGGRLIDEARLEFRGGQVVDVDGSDGVQALREFIAGDAGTSRLGELALVDNDSRVGQLNRTFGVILLDENCASHIALGFGFPETVEENDQPAVNESGFHLDLMVGSAEINVTATAATGEQHMLLAAGVWSLAE